jgi:hypothetical protein
MAEPEPLDETARAVEGLLEVTPRVHNLVSVVAARHDLTAEQIGLLRMLDEPLSLQAFADMTGLVNKAERIGLVERLTDQRDRRVRMLTLTSKARHIRQRVNRDLVSELSAPVGVSSTTRGQTARLLGAMNPGPPDDHAHGPSRGTTASAEWAPS